MVLDVTIVLLFFFSFFSVLHCFCLKLLSPCVSSLHCQSRHCQPPPHHVVVMNLPDDAMFGLLRGETMKRFKYHWDPSAPFTEQLLLEPTHGVRCREKVEHMTHGRAVLLSELSDRAIARLDAEFPGMLGSLLQCRQAALTTHGLSFHPQRFLPSKVFEVATAGALKWCDFASLTRRGTWLEVSALQGPISAAGAGVALEAFFDEKAVSESPSASSLGVFSFEQRCVASDCCHDFPLKGHQLDLQLGTKCLPNVYGQQCQCKPCPNLLCI